MTKILTTTIHNREDVRNLLMSMATATTALRDSFHLAPSLLR